ncbi:Hpt domain-containing protein [Palleronia salina]|uniref:Hpt domain-containing protein n=1 Tax=Palleronia salina TaxID=313368 RepID=A0A1M6CTD2_9RHOB|nr:Hpt domain-containing protein [Palleronia salina]SHI63998.1 Hpt domain-containing protein [Palleronia salina]
MTGESDLLNLETVALLQREFAPAVLAELVDLFAVEAAPILAQIDSGHDPSAADFHSLRGAALALGLTGVAAAAQSCEERIAAGRPAQMGRLRGLIDRSVAALCDRIGADQTRKSASVSSSVMSR